MHSKKIKGIDVVSSLKQTLTHKQFTNQQPTLAILMVGQHASEVSYATSIQRKFGPLNLNCDITTLDESISQETFDAQFDALNHTSGIDGILVLQPVPKHLSLDHAIHTIDPKKDVDCIGVANMVKIYQDGPKGFLPCTAEAVLKIIEYKDVALKGQHVVLVGFGLVIGRPLSLLLVEKGATVTICHKYTQDLAKECQRGDILVVATGVPHLIGPNHVKPGAFVIDVGINVDASGMVCGDVHYKEVEDKVSYITPVPGGVGAVTTYVLAEHVVRAFENQ